VFLGKKRSRRGRQLRRLFVLLLLLALIIGIANWAKYETPISNSAWRAGDGIRQIGFMANVQGQSYNEDVVVEEGARFEDDVVVYAGDVRVKAGGLINGDLVLYSGDVTIDDGGQVTGDVTAISGDADIAGTIDGDLVVLSGDIDLAETATVNGDLSVMSGEIDRESGATVHGNVVAGRFKLPQLPGLLESLQAPAAPAMPAIETNIQRSGGFGSVLLGFVGRLLLAAFGASLIILLTGLVYYMRPEFVQAVQQTLLQQRPLSFAVGLVINLVLTFLTGALVITLCLAPVGLAAGLLFAAINLVGWSVSSLTLGQWLLRQVKFETQPLVALLVGAFLLTSMLALGWTFGGCLRPITYLAGLLVTAFGGGAAVVYWLRLGATPKADTTIVSV